MEDLLARLSVSLMAPDNLSSQHPREINTKAMKQTSDGRLKHAGRQLANFVRRAQPRFESSRQHRSHSKAQLRKQQPKLSSSSTALLKDPKLLRQTVSAVLCRYSSTLKNGQKAEYFALMQLPRELRDMIYILALFDKTPVPASRASPGVPVRLYPADLDVNNTSPPSTPRSLRSILRGQKHTKSVSTHATSTAEPVLKTAQALFLTSQMVRAEAQYVFFRNAIIETQSLPKREQFIGIQRLSRERESTFISLRHVFSPDLAARLRYVNLYIGSTDVPISALEHQQVTSRKLSWKDKKVMQNINLQDPEDKNLFRIWKQNITFVLSLPSIKKVTIDLRDCRWRSPDDSVRLHGTNSTSIHTTPVLPPSMAVPPLATAAPWMAPNFQNLNAAALQGYPVIPCYSPIVSACRIVIKLTEDAIWRRLHQSEALRAKGLGTEDFCSDLEVHLLVSGWAFQEIAEAGYRGERPWSSRFRFPTNENELRDMKARRIQFWGYMQ